MDLGVLMADLRIGEGDIGDNNIICNEVLLTLGPDISTFGPWQTH